MAKPVRMAEVIRTTLALCVILLPSGLRARRCDRQVDSFVWSNCLECSVNAFLPNPCPSGYSQITSGEGVQRCSYLVHFGFNFGLMSVPGCQHNCSRKVTQRQCCEGFWGTDCQACPGVPACSGRGICGDTISGNGSCTCEVRMEQLLVMSVTRGRERFVVFILDKSSILILIRSCVFKVSTVES